MTYANVSYVLPHRTRGVKTAHPWLTFDLCSNPVSFGKQLHLLEAERSPGIPLDITSNTFVQSFDFAQNHLSWRFAMVYFWPVIEKLVHRIGKPIKDSCKTLDDYVYSLIDERQGDLSQKDTDKCTDLLALFIRAGDDKGSPLGRTELKDAAMNMIIAGRSVRNFIIDIFPRILKRLMTLKLGPFQWYYCSDFVLGFLSPDFEPKLDSTHPARNRRARYAFGTSKSDLRELQTIRLDPSRHLWSAALTP